MIHSLSSPPAANNDALSHINFLSITILNYSYFKDLSFVGCSKSEFSLINLPPFANIKQDMLIETGQRRWDGEWYWRQRCLMADINIY
jgi:hypothetical protein